METALTVGFGIGGEVRGTGLGGGDELAAAVCTVVLIVAVKAATGSFAAGGPAAVGFRTRIRMFNPPNPLNSIGNTYQHPKKRSLPNLERQI